MAAVYSHICLTPRRKRRQLRSWLFVLLCLVMVIFFYMWFFKPIAPQDPSNLEELRRKGWKTVYHATTFFLTGDFRHTFHFQGCREARCVLTAQNRRADVVLFHMTDVLMGWWTHAPHKQPGQVWVLYTQESPSTTLWHPSPVLDGFFNWSMTHQRDSDVVINYNDGCRWKRRTHVKERPGGYLKGRLKEAYIVTSNCRTASDRMEYIREMQKHIRIDVFGACGTPCSSRRDKCNFTSMAREYKFYLAFENSLCKDYLSEKFFRNALKADIVPVVRGGKSRENYEVFVPDSKAFIYADDFPNPASLAQRLKVIGRDEALFRRHMSWRDAFYSECPPLQTNTIACRLCQAVHNATMMRKTRVLSRVKNFWNRHRDCRDRIVQPTRSLLIQLRDYFAYFFNIN